MIKLRAVVWPNEGIKPCPKCGKGTAIIRRNKRTGRLFVGCSRFPECRWTRKTDYALDWGFQSNPVPLDPEKCAKVLYGVSLDELRTGPIIRQKLRLRDRVPKEVFHQFIGAKKRIDSMKDFIMVPIRDALDRYDLKHSVDDNNYFSFINRVFLSPDGHNCAFVTNENVAWVVRRKTCPDIQPPILRSNCGPCPTHLDTYPFDEWIKDEGHSWQEQGKEG